MNKRALLLVMAVVAVSLLLVLYLASALLRRGGETPQVESGEHWETPTTRDTLHVSELLRCLNVSAYGRVLTLPPVEVERARHGQLYHYYIGLQDEASRKWVVEKLESGLSLYIIEIHVNVTNNCSASLIFYGGGLVTACIGGYRVVEVFEGEYAMAGRVCTEELTIELFEPGRSVSGYTDSVAVVAAPFKSRLLFETHWLFCTCEPVICYAVALELYVSVEEDGSHTIEVLDIDYKPAGLPKYEVDYLKGFCYRWKT